jgi:hypothetical protein
MSADEKRIERRWPVYEGRDQLQDASKVLGSAWATHHPDRIFEVMPVEDHLAALGDRDASDHRFIEDISSWTERAEAAEKKLTEEQQRMAISRNRISELEEDLEEAEQKAFDQHVMVGESHTQLEAAEKSLEALRAVLFVIANGEYVDIIGEAGDLTAADQMRADARAALRGAPVGRPCPRCNGECMVSPTDVCPNCGGSGVADRLTALLDQDTGEDS